MRPGGLSGTTKDGVDPLEMSCFRSMFNCATIFVLMRLKYEKRVFDEVPRRFYKSLVIRSLSGTSAFICMTYGVSFLPITIFQTLFYTMPFFIAILSYFILKDKFVRVELGAMVFCFVGVIILINTKEDDKQKNSEYYFIGVIITIYFSFAASVVQVLTRYMKETHFSVI